MENVTEARGIVRRVEEPGWADGDVLLVFRRSRSGKETFHCRVEPGGEFSPTFIDRVRNFVGYRIFTGPVTHRFSQRYEHNRQGYSFTLHYRVEVQVDDAREVRLWLSQDPLQRLQEQVEDLVGGAVSRQTWEEIAAAPTEAGARALGSPRRDHRGRVGPSIAEALDQRALEMGLKLLSVDVGCELDEQAVAPSVEDARAEAELARIDADRRVGRAEVEAEAEVEAVRRRLIGQINRFDELANMLLHHLDSALGRVAGEIDDVSGLTATVEEMARLQRAIGGLVKGDVPVDGGPRTLHGSAAAEPPALPESNGLRPCAEFLSEAISEVSSLNGDETEKRGWLSYILRLVAATLDDGMEGDEVARLQEDFEPRLNASVRSLRSDEQRRFFSNLRQPNYLRSRVLGEEG